MTLSDACRIVYPETTRVRTTTTRNRDKSYKYALAMFAGLQGYLIWESLHLEGPATTREISQRTTFERTSVCARVNALVKNKLVSILGETTCSVSGKTVTVYEAVPCLFAETVKKGVE